MKEVKDKKIEIRVTASEKERIAAYCEKYGIKISDFMRSAWERVLVQEKGE